MAVALAHLHEDPRMPTVRFGLNPPATGAATELLASKNPLLDFESIQDAYLDDIAASLEHHITGTYALARKDITPHLDEWPRWLTGNGRKRRAKKALQRGVWVMCASLALRHVVYAFLLQDWPEADELEPGLPRRRVPSAPAWLSHIVVVPYRMMG